MKVLAIIPARGGSKGIPRKNLIKINGKSLVEHSVSHAIECPLINRVIVSSEDDEIIEEGKRAGAEVPFKRPAELAEDHVFDHPVFKHVLDELKSREGYEPDIVVHLRPTSPYRRRGWIDDCINLLIENKKADSVRSVSAPDKHPYRIFRIGQDGFLDPIMKHEHPIPYLLRRQDLPKMYYYNCVVDVTRPNTILNMGSMTGDHILPYIMDPSEIYDIDTPKELEITRFFLERNS